MCYIVVLNTAKLKGEPQKCQSERGPIEALPQEEEEVGQHQPQQEKVGHYLLIRVSYKPQLIGKENLLGVCLKLGMLEFLQLCYAQVIQQL